MADLTPAPSPVALPRRRAVYAAATGFLCAALTSAPALTQGDSGGAPSLGHALLFTALPGLLMPLGYLKLIGRGRARRATGAERLLTHTLLVPMAWGSATALLAGLQVFILGVFTAWTLMMTSIPLSEQAGGAQLPAPLFWTPLIGGLIRLAGGQTFDDPRDWRAPVAARRAATLLSVLVGAAVMGS